MTLRTNTELIDVVDDVLVTTLSLARRSDRIRRRGTDRVSGLERT